MAKQKKTIDSAHQCYAARPRIVEFDFNKFPKEIQQKLIKVGGVYRRCSYCDDIWEEVFDRNNFYTHQRLIGVKEPGKDTRIWKI